ncbi:Phosphoenolpyruvate synthase [Enhygromyxa salina]|uniref:Phosphoenolpyruvate synthase n=1 Tax=Enhygromyxa salina TaxID=215803 RepID=A0A0C2D5L0_9BACT|nr:phosphoenolpyruvate synthase [Enhygromyxa salina]KIG18471.1 Phosphoenolpyruvate synthase [Enhygromyxa salina]
MTHYTLPFSQVRAADLPRVGGKGANLGEMVAAGVAVPDGFCVTTEAFDAFLAASPHAAQLMARVDALEPTDLEGVRELGAQLREQLEATPIPAEVADQIRAAFAQVEGDPPWAVRSSATLEDLAEASFAGQQDTYLNVRGLDRLLDRVRACWASLFTDRAISYRRQHGFGSDIAKLSVVVQRMVQSEISGIMFTADPLSGHRGVASIDASWGLGEALVSGIVEADNYRVDRRSGALLHQRLGAKAIEIVGTSSGTEQRDVAPERRATRALDNSQLGALIELAGRVEDHYGTPQDIEWCFEGGELFLVQTRPITTLFPIPAGGEDQGLHVYVSISHIQVMTDPILPLGIDTITQAFPVGKRKINEPCPLMRRAAGRMYMDVTPAMLRGVTRKLVPNVMTLVESQMAGLLEQIIARKDFAQRDGRPQADLGFFAKDMGFTLGRNLFASLTWRDPAVNRAAVEHLAQTLPDQWARQISSSGDAAQRLQAAREVLWGALRSVMLGAFHVMLTGMISWKLLDKLCGNDPRVAELARGLDGNVTTQMDLELGDLADIVRTHDGLYARLSADITALQRPTEIDALDGAAQLLADWQTFLATYGHRAVGEIDMTKPRWAEDPSSLLHALSGMLRDRSIGGHRAQQRATEQSADQAGQGLIANAKFGRRWLIRRLIPRMRTGLSLREHPKFVFMRGLYLVRGAILQVAEDLVQAQRLAKAEDIWWLNYDDIERAVAGESMHALVESRRLEYRGYAKLRPPRVITSEGEIPRPPRAAALPPGTFAGVSASAGIVEGVARVIMDPTTEVMHAGEILVAPFTDPGWTPLFIHASALVMEVGGLMTHGSVVAREYGIPAVVGLDDATRLITSGQRIRVDGDTGIVTILSSAEPQQT